VLDELATVVEMDVPAIVARLTARIAAAPTDPQPSDNIFVEDVFPPAVYRELLARLPDDDAMDFLRHRDALTPDRRSTRRILDLTEESLERLPAEHRPFWRAMIQVFTAPALVDAVVRKFQRALDERFDGAVPELVAVPLLYRDYPGYRISIHPDAETKLATLQFYLPADESQIHLGTTFHRRDGETFEELKTNPFKPNSAYAFVRTEESWHSVRELGPHEAVRNTIALTFFVRGQEYRSAPRPM
jgi:hypothetical protein